MSEEREWIERIAGHYRSRWPQGYARGKLRTDPVYAAAAEVLVDSPLPLLDLGCGMGLLEFWLREAGCGARLVGCDFDEAKVARAQRIAAVSFAGVDFHRCDLTAEFPETPPGNVAIFDLLHYLAAAERQSLLVKAAERVATGGVCLIRATLRDGSWRFRATQAEEWFIRAITWMRSGAVHFAPAGDILCPFLERGFRAEVRPLWGEKPLQQLSFFAPPGKMRLYITLVRSIIRSNVPICPSFANVLPF